MTKSYSQSPFALLRGREIFRRGRTSVLLVIDALYMESDNGALSHAELRELTHMSKYTVSRTVRTGCEFGLLEKVDRHTVALAQDWQSIVDGYVEGATE